MNIECEGNPLKLSKIFYALLKYKWINLLILLLFWALGMFYYKIQDPLYGVSATIEVKNVQNVRRDFFGNAIGAKTAGIETEIDIIRSNLLIEKTLKSMGKNVNYFRENGLFDTQELYKTSPFQVTKFFVHTTLDYRR